MNQKQALGKGLASLLPSAATHTQQAITASGASDQMVNKDRHPGISLAVLEDIKTNPFQPRRDFDDDTIDELAQSIRENGLIQPLIVRKTQNGYELIAGERRMRAAKKVGLKQVPVVIRRATDKESLELAIIENIQREDLNCVDEAMAYFQLGQDFALTQEEIAKKVGKDRATIANFLRILRLPELILNDLRTGNLSHGHGKALLALDENEERLKIREEILLNRWSVRETERQVEFITKKKLTASEADETATIKEEKLPIQVRFDNLMRELSQTSSCRVEIKGNGKRGKIQLKYTNSEELERIISVLQRKDLWQVVSH